MLGGDSYALEASALSCPYARSLGFVSNRSKPGEAGARAPWIKGRTGTLTIWRLCTLVDSQKLPNVGAGALAGGVGITDPVVGARAHPGDGNGMNVANLNTLMADAFTEWEVPVPSAPSRAGDPHLDVNLGTYRHWHNLIGAALAGIAVKGTAPGAAFPNLAADGDITNNFVQWDHYRTRLPPNLPANRVQLVSNVVAGQADGTSATNVCNAASTANTNHNNAGIVGFFGLGGLLKPDQGLNMGVAAITPYPGTPNQHESWIKGVVLLFAGVMLDKLTPQTIPPIKMYAVRWPALYQDHWSDGWNTDSIGVAGYCRGSSQSFFAAAPGGGNPDTFEHEMGHSLHLAHFITWGATNSCWKHHDHGYPHCIMGYYNAPGTAANPALPYTVPGSAPAINLNTGARADFCAKCRLKLRGWNEEVIPCNWTNPSVF